MDYGFVKERRREEAVLCSQLMSRRLREGGFTHAVCLKDLSNAFGSTDHATLGQVVELHAKQEDHQICKQRFQQSLIQFEASDGTLVVRPKQGGCMGDPFIVAAFMRTFNFPILSWGMRLREWDMRANILVGEWKGWRVDTSLQKYADDLNKIIVADPGDSLSSFLDKLVHVDRDLDEALIQHGYAQNASKQEFLVHFCSAGSCRSSEDSGG